MSFLGPSSPESTDDSRVEDVEDATEELSQVPPPEAGGWYGFLAFSQSDDRFLWLSLVVVVMVESFDGDLACQYDFLDAIGTNGSSSIDLGRGGPGLFEMCSSQQLCSFSRTVVST